ncbi:ParB/RepB/Spo0J family partition protein [Streptomyces chumphonensis]|uniref:ParB/RepB/Spo0J family partition protein n=1 Tax=Streptomyces chumphonensis TaxID=1214925 RepID=A0A927F4A4_9ACTN|nr:ParB/RepB/Spo0J family partition protein [Streptomyces chumphonensis]MBD3934946.1 ParB/RepB/Spo0J family partition protein [Streptomyces chumphonensis]
MSKADKLKASASFGQARSVSARRAAIGAATGAPTLGVPAPNKAPLKTLAPNPFNPRDELTDIEETAASLVERGQIQPVAVVHRTAFLSVHPGHEDGLGDAEYVVIDGNRRLAAATKAGLEELRIDINDDLAASAADLLESALIANIHRVDVPPLDQAKAIQELVSVHGSQSQVAKRLGKTPAWVSQRLALLQLTPELQEKVETGDLKVEPARRIGRLPKDQQAAAAHEARTAARPPQQRSRRTLAEGPDTETINGVNAPGAEATSDAAPAGSVNAVNATRSETGTGSSPTHSVNGVNADRTAPGAGQHFSVPCSSPQQVADALEKHLSPQDLAAVAELLLDRVGGAPG